MRGAGSVGAIRRWSESSGSAVLVQPHNVPVQRRRYAVRWNRLLA